MGSEELRAACEMAGLTVEPSHCDRGFMVNVDNGLWVRDHNPVLPAYVADLLAQRDEITEYTVSEMDTKRVPYKYECEVLSSELEKHAGTGDTPAEAIIRACMDVLKGGGA